MYTVLIIILTILLFWHSGCCIKKRISGVLCPCCSKCGCKTCPICNKKRVCSNCVVDPSKSVCGCSPCSKYKCDLKEAFQDSDTANNVLTNGGGGETVFAVSESVKKPTMEIEKIPGGSNNDVRAVVKTPPPPKCDCPECPKNPYNDVPGTYYPIYQPLPYGIRY
jgi:hypothetical protein